MITEYHSALYDHNYFEFGSRRSLQDWRSSIRLPLQTSRPDWAQYRQIACWTNRGNGCGKPGIELPGIDPLGHGLYNVGAAATLVAGSTIGMVGLETCQDAGADQSRTKVSMAIMLAPTSRQGYRRLGAASRIHDGHGQDLVQTP